MDNAHCSVGLHWDRGNPSVLLSPHNVDCMLVIVGVYCRVLDGQRVSAVFWSSGMLGLFSFATQHLFETWIK